MNQLRNEHGGCAYEIGKCRAEGQQQEKSAAQYVSTALQHNTYRASSSIFSDIFEQEKKKVCTAQLLNQVTPVSPSCGFERARRVYRKLDSSGFVCGLFVLVLCVWSLRVGTLWDSPRKLFKMMGTALSSER